MADFNVELNAQFGTLFTELHKVTDSLKQVQVISQQVSVALQNDFKNAAGRTTQFNNNVKDVGSLLSRLNASIGSLGAVESTMIKNTDATVNFTNALKLSLDEVNALANAAALEGEQFKSNSDEKQQALQKEITILKQLQDAAAKYGQLQENAQKFTQEIAAQTERVRELTAEIKRTQLPEQADPFTRATAGVVSLRTQIQNARQAADVAAVTYGEWTPQFAEATKKVAILQNRLDQINKTAQAFNPEARLAGFTQVVRGVVGGFSAVTAAFGFLGDETDDVQKALIKVQQLLLFSSGINEVLQLGTAFKSFGLQLGLAKESVSALGAVQEELADINLKDTASVGASTASIVKFTTGADTAQSALNKLKGAKVEDAAATVQNVAATSANATAQAAAAAATEANAAAKTQAAAAGNAEATAEARAAAAAAANAGAQTVTAAATSGAATAAGVAAGAFRTLWAVMLANPLTAILAVVAAVAGGMLLFADNTDKAAEEQTKLNDAARENFKILLELDKIFNKSSQDRIDKLEQEVKLIQDASPEIILEKEIELAEAKRLLAVRSIADLNLNKQRLGELTAEYESAITALGNLKNQLILDPKNEDLKKRTDAQQGVVDALDTQLKKGEALWQSYNDSVTEQAIKTAALLKSINENFFNSLKVQAEARVAISRSGTDERVKAEIALARTQRDIEIEALREKIKSIDTEQKARKAAGNKATAEQFAAEVNARANLNAQIEKLVKETEVQITRITTEAAIRRINTQKSIDQANLDAVQKNSEEELNLKIKIIQETAQAELLSLDKTAKEKTAFLLDALHQETELRRQFLSTQIKESIEIDRVAVATQLAISKIGSEEELKLKKESVDAEVRIDKQAAIDTITNHKLLVATLGKIDAEAAAQKDELEKDFARRSIARALSAANQIIELENMKLKAQGDSPAASEALRLSLQQKVLQNEKIIIENRFRALMDMFRRGLIAEEDFQNQLNELQKAGAQNAIDINANRDAAIESSLRQLISFAKTAFPDLSSRTQAALDQLGDSLIKLAIDFENGTVSFSNAIATANSLIQTFTSLSVAQINAQQQVLNDQLAANDTYLSSIEDQLAAKVQQINEETELNAKNVANNLTLRQQELNILNQQKKNALEEDKKIKNERAKLAKEQAQIEAVSQASSLLLAVANILESFSVLPFGIGIGIAAGVIAGMYAIFSSYQSKIKSATASSASLESGGDIALKEGRGFGVIKGKRHTQGGHKIEGTNLEVEDGEFLNNRASSRDFRHWLVGANKRDFKHITFNDILNLPGIRFPELSKMKAEPPVEINRTHIDRMERNRQEVKVLQFHHSTQLSTAALEKKFDELTAEVKKFKKVHEEKPVMQTLKDGRLVIIQGNTTKIVTTQSKE